MIVTIDGPAGAGKSTVAKNLALRLSDLCGMPFEYLDTGSMYRAVALLGIRRGIDWNNAGEVERTAGLAQIDVVDGYTFLNGEDVTDAVRTPEVTEQTRFAANNSAVRAVMVEAQRRIAQQFLAAHKGLVTEGRDQGTAVFPDASFKFFLTATPEERAKRRLGELQQRGLVGNFGDILKQITERDARDAARTVGPLCEPKDSYRIVSDELSAEEVIDAILSVIRC